MTVTAIQRPTPAPLDVLSGTSCILTPARLPWGPGFYLVAANSRVEAGPFPSTETAFSVGDWLEDQGLGVHPVWDDGPPYRVRYSAIGLIVGSRVRDRLRASA